MLVYFTEMCYHDRESYEEEEEDFLHEENNKLIVYKINYPFSVF